MMTPSALILASLCSVSLAAVHSGKASAEWISSSRSTGAGMPVKTAIRLAVDEGYHTYWVNPGEGGMPLAVKWELPAGWVATDPEYPVPMRFTTGDLPGFGYEGSVVFPVNLTPPPGFSGEVTLKGKVSWLTCDDKGCIPGSADLELTLSEGEPAPSAEAKVIDAALLRIPLTPGNRIKLMVVEKPESLVLNVQGLSNPGVDLAEYEVFPATPDVIDAGAEIRFTRQADSWTAEVPKSEYAAAKVSELTLVLAGKSEQAPISLTWKSNGD